MDEELVTLADFAKELGLDKSAARKAIIKLQQSSGRVFMQHGRVRDNQSGWVLSRSAADEVLELRKQQGTRSATGLESLLRQPVNPPCTSWDFMGVDSSSASLTALSKGWQPIARSHQI
jgi:hypothetical protein